MRQGTAATSRADIWFTQPIEQRINEMVSGVRADLALKLFGDDFDTLVSDGHANSKASCARSPAAPTWSTEQMPASRCCGSRSSRIRSPATACRLRRCSTSSSRSAAKTLGEVVEGQLRFPLVVRLPENLRDNPEAICVDPCRRPHGERIPLSRLGRRSRGRRPAAASRASGASGGSPSSATSAAATSAASWPRPSRGSTSEVQLPEAATASSGAASSRTGSGARRG